MHNIGVSVAPCAVVHVGFIENIVEIGEEVYDKAECMYNQEHQKYFVYGMSDLPGTCHIKYQEREHIYHQTWYKEFYERGGTGAEQKAKACMAFTDHADEMHRDVGVDQSEELLEYHFCILCDMHSGSEHHNAGGADSQTERDKNDIDQMKSLVEPLLICVLAGVVGVILLSIIQPMFSIYSQVK